MTAETINQALDRARTVSDTGLRLLDRRERPTFHDWSQIYDKAREVCAGLQALGVERGERVAIDLLVRGRRQLIERDDGGRDHVAR